MFYLFAILAAIAASRALEAAEDWSRSPEAYFLTSEESEAWKALATDSARAEFVAAYWRRRDPTPDTERNEFRDTVLARIRAADARFTSGKVPGSRTVRGLALVVLGAPAIERQTVGPVKPPLVEVQPGKMGLSHEAFSSAEWHAWIYERDRNAELLDALDRPSADVAFIVERGRKDQMQSAREFAGWRERLARLSIVSP